MAPFPFSLGEGKWSLHGPRALPAIMHEAGLAQRRGGRGSGGGGGYSGVMNCRCQTCRSSTGAGDLRQATAVRASGISPAIDRRNSPAWPCMPLPCRMERALTEMWFTQPWRQFVPDGVRDYAGIGILRAVGDSALSAPLREPRPACFPTRYSATPQPSTDRPPTGLRRAARFSLAMEREGCPGRCAAAAPAGYGCSSASSVRGEPPACSAPLREPCLI